MKITPIDFDSQIGAWLQDENDKQLYAIATLYPELLEFEVLEDDIFTAPHYIYL